MKKIQELNVYAVIFYNGKILVLKRKDDIWEFPGGSVDWGERPEQSISREVKEETGLVVHSLVYTGITSAIYEKDGNEKHSIYLIYKGEVNSDRVTLSREHSEYRWLFPNELNFLKLGLNAEPVLEML